jgi:hypothetical protein
MKKNRIKKMALTSRYGLAIYNWLQDLAIPFINADKKS